MKLLYPEFLYALSLLLIPILIHLFNFRKYKTIRFSQVRFLRNIQKETQSTSKLKHLLVLLSRCFAISALVLAFCQPYLPVNDQKLVEGKTGVNIYLDNSFSMQLKGEQGNHLEMAQSKALSILDAYAASDRFRILSNDFESIHNRWMNKEDFIAALQNIDFSPTFRPISRVVERLMESPESNVTNQTFYFLTDLQKNQIDLENISDSLELNFLPLSAEIEKNYQLSGIAFAQPFHLKQQEEELQYVIQNPFNYSEEKLPVKLYLNQELKSPQFVNLSAEDSLQGSIRYRNTMNEKTIEGILTIKDFPLTFDDTLYFSYPLQENIRILHLTVDSANKNIQTLFGRDSLFDYQVIPLNQLDYSLLSPPALVILDELKEISSGLQNKLIAFVEAGGSMVVFPSPKMNPGDFSDFLTASGVGRVTAHQQKEMQVSQLNKNAAVFKAVFDQVEQNIQLPKVKSKWNFSLNTKNVYGSILSFSDNSEFVFENQISKGTMYLSAVGLSEKESNLVNHAIFVPLLYNMALQSVMPRPLYYNINQNSISLNANFIKNQGESPFHLVGKNIDIIPAQRLSGGELILEPGENLKKAGHYQLVKEGNVFAGLSFNYDRKESELEFYDVKGLKQEADLYGLKLKTIEDVGEVLTNTLTKNQAGTPLWKYFILLTLFFIGLEILFLRIF